MSNHDSSQFGLRTSSLIFIIACLASRYLIALKKEKKAAYNTLVEHLGKKDPQLFFFEHKAC